MALNISGKFQRSAMFLGLISIIATAPSMANSTVQGFKCGNAASYSFETESNQEVRNHYTIGGKVMRVSVKDGTAGYRVSNLPAPCILRPSHTAVKLAYREEGGNTKGIFLRFKFKPDPSKDALVTVDKQWSEFRKQNPDRKHDYEVASISDSDIWGSQEGVPNLREVTVYVPAGVEMTLGRMEFEHKEGNSWTREKVGNVNFEDGGCAFTKD